LKKELLITYQAFTNITDLSAPEAELLSHALSAAGFAYAPYSEFEVGAAIRLTDNQVLSANNQENAAYPSGICAERNVLFYAGAQGLSGQITHLAIRATKYRIPVIPCGGCLQVMLEFERRANRKLIILTQGISGNILRFEGVEGVLLPFTFQL
jgi:cytidine deaminase